MSISIEQYSVRGDCTNTNSAELFFSVTGSTPPFAVNCITAGCPLPTSALTEPYEYRVTGLSGGTYFLQITDGTSASIIITVYISTGTTATIDSTNTSCGFNNGSITGFTSSVYGFTTFLLYDITNNLITSGISTTNYLDFTSLSAGTYYIVADDGGGCNGITASVILNPSSGITFGGYVVDDASCIGNGSGKIFITGLTSPSVDYTITWSSNANGQTGSTITGLTAGVYIATVTNSIGCSSSQSFTVNSVAPLTSGGFIVISQPTCFSNDGEVEFIIVDGTPPYFFSASTGQVEITFSSSVTFTGLSTGFYSFLVTDAGLCTIYDSVSLTTPNSFTTVQLTTTNSTCSVNNGSLNVLVDGGLSPVLNLQISISGSTGISKVGLMGNSNQTFNGLSNGTYIVTVTSTGCTYTTSTVIESVNLFSATTQVTGTTCGLNNGILQVEASTGGTFPYIYTLVGPTGTNPTTVTSPFNVFNNLYTGNYVLTIQDSSTPNCIQTFPINISTSQPVNFNLVPNQPIVGKDGSITAFITQGTPPFTLNWSGGTAETQDGYVVTGLTAGTYSLTVIDESGCSLTKYTTLQGTKKFSNYQYYNVCNNIFIDSGLVTKRTVRSMFLEGFYDLTSGDTNCIIDSATFSISAKVGSQSAITEFYSSNGGTDYPNDIQWAEAITDILNGFVGISDVTIDLVSNRITIKTNCEEINKSCKPQVINPLQDTEIEVNLVIDYNISCVDCS